MHRILVGALAVVFLAGIPLTSRAQVGVAEYPFPSGIDGGLPWSAGITLGPDGALWFTEDGGNAGLASIGRIDVTGAIREYPIPQNSAPNQIITGPDGNLWFTATGGNYIGKITPAGVLTQFLVPTAGANPTGITVGSDGNMWFTEPGPSANAIASVSTSGVFSSPIPIPTPNGQPTRLTVGPDGNIWFTELNAQRLGTVRGRAITEYITPTFASMPLGIITGPDGNLWFTELNASRMGKITTTGTITEYALSTAGFEPTAICIGPDNALWFVGGGIGRITTSGSDTEYAIGSGSAIVKGFDNALWFNEGNAIGRFGAFAFERFEQVPGELTQLSVGSDGTVWGVNSAQQIYTFDYSNGGWTHIPGELTQISVGSNSAVWGINAMGHIYQWTGTTWEKAPGSLAQIAVGADGDVWGLNGASEIYHYEPSGQTWAQISGTLSRIAVGSAGAVYGVNSAGWLYWFNPGTGNFQLISSTAGLTQIAVGVDGDLWGVKSGVAYHYNVPRNRLDPTAGDISQVALGSGAAVFGLNASGETFQWNAASQMWEQVPGVLISISVGATGTVWGIDPAGDVYQLAGNPKRAEHTANSIGWLSISGLSVGADGSVWALDLSGAVQFFNPGTQAFEPVPNSPVLTDISVGALADLWGMNCSAEGSGSNCTIYSYNANSGTWSLIPGGLIGLQVAVNGAVWGINNAGLIYTYDSSASTWVNVPGQLAGFSVGADGTVWGINSQDYIYRYTGKTWLRVPGSLANISVGDANNVWGTNSAGEVFYFNGATGQWANVPGALLTYVQAAFDGAVWGSESGQSFYQWNASAQTFDLVPVNPPPISAYLYVGNSVNVWTLTTSHFPDSPNDVFAYF